MVDLLISLSHNICSTNASKADLLLALCCWFNSLCPKTHIYKCTCAFYKVKWALNIKCVSMRNDGSLGAPLCVVVREPEEVMSSLYFTILHLLSEPMYSILIPLSVLTSLDAWSEAACRCYNIVPLCTPTSNFNQVDSLPYSKKFIFKCFFL